MQCSNFYRSVMPMGMLAFEAIHNMVMDKMAKVIERDIREK